MPVRGRNAGNKGQGSKWITRKRRDSVHDRDGWTCVWCGMQVWTHRRTLPGVLVLPALMATLDHVIPREHGGTNATHNLITSCMGCNRRRGSMSAATYCLEHGGVECAWRVLRAVTTPVQSATLDQP